MVSSWKYVPLLRRLLIILFLVAFDNARAFRQNHGLAHPFSRRTSTKPLHSIATSRKTKYPINEAVLRELNTCESGTQARKVLEKALVSSGDSQERNQPLYGSISIPEGASDRFISDGDLAIQTKVRNGRYSIMELIELNGGKDADRASLAVLSIMVASTASALVANQNLPGPEIIRFVVVWILSFAPLAFVGYGIAAPEKLQTVLVQIQRYLFPIYRKRMIQHEAAHFLMGHLLGMPVKGYATNAMKNAVEFFPLSDPDVGRDQAALMGFDRNRRHESPSASTPSQWDRPYFSKEGRGGEIISTKSVFRTSSNVTANPFTKLNSLNEPSNAWPYRGFDPNTIDKLAVISVAGVCAEILAFGNAEGGYADLSQLRQIFSSAEPELKERDMENRVRYALGYTMSQLRLHLGALDALARTMEQNGSVSDCVLAIESCPNVSGQDGTTEDYERRRRDLFRSESFGIFERGILSGSKNVDVEDDRFVEGKGGGYRKENFQLTGDDPLYAAILLATVFLAWSSNGGLSLH